VVGLGSWISIKKNDYRITRLVFILIGIYLNYDSVQVIYLNYDSVQVIYLNYDSVQVIYLNYDSVQVIYLNYDSVHYSCILTKSLQMLNMYAYRYGTDRRYIHIYTLLSLVQTTLISIQEIETNS